MIGLISYFATQNYLNKLLNYQPSWYYNVDSALYFIIFYIVGYVSFGIINSILKLDFTHKKILFIVGFILTFTYSALVYFRKDVALFFDSRTAYECYGIIRPLIIISFLICVAYLLKDIKYMNQLGKHIVYVWK